MLSYVDRKPYINAATAAGIQTVFNRTRLSHQSWEARQLSGRLDGRQAWRNDARGSIDIFRDRRLPSPTKLDVRLIRRVGESSRWVGCRGALERSTFCPS